MQGRYEFLAQDRIIYGFPAAQGVAELIEALVRTLGMPLTLRDVGVRRDQFDAVASASMENVFVRSNPRPIRSPQDIIDILNMAW
jgi:alcohol dehydrogenase class IV